MARRKIVNQNQSVTQIVKVVLWDLKKPKRKKRKNIKTGTKKSAYNPQPQPYQVPLHTPPFPVPFPSYKRDNQTKADNMLRNYIGIQTRELKRLRGDLTAYRQEAQTNFRENIAYPRASIDLGRVSNPSEDFTDEVRSEISDASVYQQPSPPDAPPFRVEGGPMGLIPSPPDAPPTPPFRVEGGPLGLIPLYTNPLKANPLTPPDKMAVSIQPKSMPPFQVPAMGIEMSQLTAGGRRRGAGRKPQNFKSNVELRQELKRDYDLKGLYKFGTSELRDIAVRTSGKPSIIYKS